MTERLLFILLFIPGVVPLIQSVPRQYYPIQQSMTWSDAQAYCRAQYTDLAIIESDDDMIHLRYKIQYQQFSSSAWIGLYRDLSGWYWSLGSEPEGSLSLWSTGQPNNLGGIQYCGEIRPDGWHDNTCSIPTPFICFDETKTGDQRYIYVSAAMQWHHAQVYCRNQYTDLASVRDVAENSLILGMISDRTLFGLTKDSWKWLNRTTYSTISWKSGEPDITSGAETCGFINNGEAGDELCTTTMPFICFRERMVQQQIMRMEVRSNSDVNDSAVMDAIMERIKQKLEERGLVKTIMVKWRVQPDGKVFHKKRKEDL